MRNGVSDGLEGAAEFQQCGFRDPGYDFGFSFGRSGNSHKYGDTSVETSFEMNDERGAPKSSAMPPSSHNDCRRKNPRSSRDRTGMARIRETVQIPWKSTPSRSP